MQSTLAPTSSRAAAVPCMRGKDRRQRRPVHARNRSQHHLGRGHGGTGVAGSHEPGRAPIPHQPQAHADRRVALGAHRLHRFIFHGDDFAGVDNLNGEFAGAGVARQFLSEGLFRPDQQDAHVIVPRRLDRTFDLRLGPAVRTHRVQGYDAWHGVALLAGFLDFQDFAAFVVATLGAGAMRQLALVAVGAF